MLGYIHDVRSDTHFREVWLPPQPEQPLLLAAAASTQQRRALVSGEQLPLIDVHRAAAEQRSHGVSLPAAGHATAEGSSTGISRWEVVEGAAPYSHGDLRQRRHSEQVQLAERRRSNYGASSSHRHGAAPARGRSQVSHGTSGAAEPRPYYRRLQQLIVAGVTGQQQFLGAPAAQHSEEVEPQVARRKAIYMQNLWALPIAQPHGRTERAAPAAGLDSSAARRRLEDFIDRELRALLLESDITLVRALVMGLVCSQRPAGHEPRDGGPTSSRFDPVAGLRRFLFEHAEHFWHEVQMFSISGLTIAAYDVCVAYATAEHVAPYCRACCTDHGVRLRFGDAATDNIGHVIRQPSAAQQHQPPSGRPSQSVQEYAQLGTDAGRQRATGRRSRFSAAENGAESWHESGYQSRRPGAVCHAADTVHEVQPSRQRASKRQRWDVAGPGTLDIGAGRGLAASLSGQGMPSNGSAIGSQVGGGAAAADITHSSNPPGITLTADQQAQPRRLRVLNGLNELARQRLLAIDAQGSALDGNPRINMRNLE